MRGGCATGASTRSSTSSSTRSSWPTSTSPSCPSVLDPLPLWSARRPAPARFRRGDHLGDPARPLADCVREVVASEGAFAAGPIRTLTNLRYFGHGFNPVTFHFCFDPAGERVDSVLADVSNTPWGESHPYVIEQRLRSGRVIRGSVEKQFHVSPLMGMEQTYEWRTTVPGDDLQVHIESHHEGARTFDATLSLERRELSPANATADARPLSGDDGAGRREDLLAGAAAAAQGRSLPPAPGADVIRAALARRLLFRLVFERIAGGRLTILDGGRRYEFGDPADGLDATVTVHDRRAYAWTLRGSTGWGEGYVEGLWTTDDLVGLARLACRNLPALDAVRRRWHWALGRLQRLAALVPRNTRRGARANISAHYDLGNDLFASFLDETMMYSCAWFPSPEATLHEAQLARLERICEQLELGPDDHLLEIGSGWGAMAIHAAATRGCRVTTTTISVEQHALAVERVRAAGLEDRVEVLLSDYRDLEGTYSKLVSLEMIEAVGWQYFPTYFRTCSRLLEPDGAMLLQAIVIDDDAYEVEKASKSFANTHVFPGGCLPSERLIGELLDNETDMTEALERRHHRSLPADARDLAEPVQRRLADACAATGTTTASTGSGTSTSRSRRRASASGGSATSSSSSPSPGSGAREARGERRPTGSTRSPDGRRAAGASLRPERLRANPWC